MKSKEAYEFERLKSLRQMDLAELKTLYQKLRAERSTPQKKHSTVMREKRQSPQDKLLGMLSAEAVAELRKAGVV